jgi:uncharacterized protein YqeY
MENKLEQDLKAAMLAGDKQRVSVLRGLKAVLLNVKVATGKRESGLSDDEILVQLSKQAKQRQESADLFKQGGNQAKADDELAEKVIIESYLPAQLSEDELNKLIDEAIAQSGVQGLAGMGQVIGQVKAKTGAAADGALIARLAKEKLQ